MDTEAPVPERTYAIINLSKWRYRNFEIHHNDQVILWVNIDTPFLGLPQINIQTDSAAGPIVAAAKLRGMSAGCRVFVGNPDCVAKEQWTDVRSESLLGKCYRLEVGSRAFLWKRTHNSTYGSSKWSSDNFKLVDASDETVVYAVYLRDLKMFRDRKTAGRLHWYQSLNQQEELAVMAAILGIEERIRRTRNTTAASAGAAGGGAGA